MTYTSLRSSAKSLTPCTRRRPLAMSSACASTGPRTTLPSS